MSIKYKVCLCVCVCVCVCGGGGGGRACVCVRVDKRQDGVRVGLRNVVLDKILEKYSTYHLSTHQRQRLQTQLVWQRVDITLVFQRSYYRVCSLRF